MIILGIETSCDETALSIIEASGDINVPKFKILNTALHSQVETHRQYGGVYPNMAKREHTKNIIPLFDSLVEKNILEKESDAMILSEELKKQITDIFKKEENLASDFIEYFSKAPKQKIDMIAVTVGPGLEPALWVGINFAKALSLIWNIPVMPVNHMEGHILSVLSSSNSSNDLVQNEQIKFPAIALLISGGHTELVLVNSFGDYKIIGQTKDDAVGEAFDKVARLLDLPYPGGPEISKLADQANLKSDNLPEIKLPRPMLKTNDFDFSFSGLKTAVLYLVKKLKEQNLESGGVNFYNDAVRQIIAHEFQEAVVEVLFKKTKKAIEQFLAQSLIIGGGVIANKKIREKFLELENSNFNVYVPEMSLTTDNAVMIAFAGYVSSLNHKPTVNPDLKALGNMGF